MLGETFNVVIAFKFFNAKSHLIDKINFHNSATEFDN